MENSKLKRAVALALSVVMVFCLFVTASPALYATNTVAEEDNSTTDEALEILGDDKWAKYKAKYASVPNYKGDPITVGSDAADLSKGGEITDYLGETNVVFVSDTGSVSWKINVPETGLYAMDIVYNYLGSDSKEAKAADIERTLRINDKVPYTELRNLIFTKKWVDQLTEYKLKDGETVEKLFPMTEIYRLLFGAGENFEIYQGRQMYFFVPREPKSSVDWYIASKILKDEK